MSSEATIGSVKQKDSAKRGELVRRNKEEIVKDIYTIINNNQLEYGTKFYCVLNAIGIWTELDGKFEGSKKKSGCPYWSEKALIVVQTITERSQISKLLRHEHIVPRIVLIDKILGFPPNKENTKSNEEISKIFEDFCKGVVVTKEDDEKLNKEHQKNMPKGWNWCDPWARYKCNEIKVYNPASVKWLNKKFEIVDPVSMVMY